MSDRWSRRDWLKTLSAASASAFVPFSKMAAELVAPLKPTVSAAPRYSSGAIIDLHSTSDVFIPPRGDSWMKFSFDFPEPAVAFGGHRFSFLLFTAENTYGLHLPSMRAEGNGDALVLTCDRLVFAGGQQEVAGQVRAEFTRTGSTIEWTIRAQMDRPIKSVTTVIRDVPRGKISLAGGALRGSRRRRRGWRISVLRRRSAWRRSAGEHEHAGSRGAGGGSRRVVDRFARRSRSAQAVLFPGGRARVSRGSRVRTRRLAGRRAGDRSRLAHWTRAVAGRGARCALGPDRARIRSRVVDTAHRRAIMDARARARGDAARHALHRIHLQRFRAAARDPEMDLGAHPAGARARLPPRMGRPLLLGLSELHRARAHGR